MARFNFKLDKYKDDGEFELIPKAEYEFEVEKCEEKETKAGTGSYLNFQFSIVGEKYKNRKIFDLMNINNPNETAERIGRGRLHKLALACGFEELDDSDQLIGKIFKGMVDVEKGTGGYRDKNVIAKFIPRGGHAPASKEASGGDNPWDDD